MCNVNDVWGFEGRVQSLFFSITLVLSMHQILKFGQKKG